MTASTSRRSVIAAAGAATAAVSLAACGSDSGGGESKDTGSGEGGGDGGGDAAGGALGKASEIPEGGGKVFKDQKVVVTRPSANEYKAFDSTCTHQGCAVKEITGGNIVCPCHNSKFDINDGSPTGGPAKKPLAPKKVVVEGGEIKLA
ncbi:Ferredoxin subunit of nitrite reductase or a ring-hydroxylating dioxygenase [Streptomyces sp. WMMB 714]|jgi:nitrite reductase/ring-hydroxylating ferredoxin subunit|uniref:Rieske (2Fe-2S) protein n=1 Tax=Streptomyces sp. WMMB 714 TaxID=1286822 RepID=UPI000823AF12|nr:Rieske (2Fe-2S) protein [Streptomyces sp. WMMB 714]SCK52293.1 Ferredoxin subunit of nitrite reductase or a ring-hydroxylating dioxygenase [Streptomyces sp. WMMB 714]